MNLPPLELGQLFGQAQARPGVLAAVVLAAVGYLVAAGRVRGWNPGRTAAFLGGLVVVLIATCSGIEAYGHVLEWVHMIEHLLLIMVAPVLLVGTVGRGSWLVQNANTIVKGLRAISDFEYEFEMNQLNRKLAPDIESMYIFASSSYSFLSSTGVKEMATFGGDVSDLVPEPVAKALAERISRS